MLGDKGLQEVTYKSIEEKKSESLQGHQRLARHHRQVLGRDAAAGHRRDAAGALLVDDRSERPKTYQADYLLDAQTIAPGATGDSRAHGCSPAPRKRR